MFQSICTTIITNIQTSLGKVSGWTMNSVIDHTISISKYNSLAGSSDIKLPKELDHPRKGLINIHNINDNKCFKWCLVRYLYPADHNPRRISKADKNFAKRLDFKDIKTPVKIRDIHKIEKKNSIGISVFGYENKEKYPIYVSKQCCEEKHVNLLMIERGEKNMMFLSKISIRRGRKHFCRSCLHAFITEEMLKCRVKDYFKIDGKQTTKMHKKGEYFKFKNVERKIKSPFLSYADFESTLVP